MAGLVHYGINWSGPWSSARSGKNFNDSVNIRQHDMLTEIQNQELQIIKPLQESGLFCIDINITQSSCGYWELMNKSDAIFTFRAPF